MQEEYANMSRMSGFELEFFLVDKDGKIVNDADLVLNSAKSKLTHVELKQECGKSMIEIASLPHISTEEVFTNFFDDYETLLYDLHKKDLGLYYYGTYPGRNNTIMRSDPRYKAKAKIIGEEKFNNAGRCVGFHYHYSLPRNSFNENIKFFYHDIHPKKQEKVLNLFNLYIALDPALTTFMQSSPYFEGNYLGKDSRVIVYRGDPAFTFQDALYSKYPFFGNLNKYAADFKTIVERTVEKAMIWKRLLKDHNYTFSDFQKQDNSILDSSWNPVKISPHGTIESRGSDMNSLANVFAVSGLLKTLSKFVQNNPITIVPSETGKENPFRLENDKLYVPEQTYLNNDLQKNSALSGLDNKKVYHYCDSLLKLLKKIAPENLTGRINKLSGVLEEKKTISDEIIAAVKKKQGYTSYKTITDDTAHEIALDTSEKAYKDLIITRKMSDRMLNAGII